MFAVLTPGQWSIVDDAKFARQVIRDDGVLYSAWLDIDDSLWRLVVPTSAWPWQYLPVGHVNSMDAERAKKLADGILSDLGYELK